MGEALLSRIQTLASRCFPKNLANVSTSKSEIWRRYFPSLQAPHSSEPGGPTSFNKLALGAKRLLTRSEVWRAKFAKQKPNYAESSFGRSLGLQQKKEQADEDKSLLKEWKGAGQAAVEERRACQSKSARA